MEQIKYIKTQIARPGRVWNKERDKWQMQD